MNHTHAYTFWHAHQHTHIDTSKGIGGWEPETSEYYRADHGTGHYHNWVQIHDHGKKMGLMPHTHQVRQAHIEDDEHTKHHHAIVDLEEEEHHPECKLPYYGGGSRGCISRCEVGREKEEK